MASKLISWNVNGLRSCARQGFTKWFAKEDADVICLQEIKVFQEQLPPEVREPRGYHSFWHSAERPGYSGVALYSKQAPESVRYGIGQPEIDREGRVIVVEFKNYTVLNTYFPNSQRDHSRLPYKLKFCAALQKFCEKERAKGKTLLICGDLNIAHQEIDLKNPKSNMKNAGFLPQERAWLTRFLAKGYVDTFRHFTPEGGHYTWWSYRPGVRERNIGWRLDYFLTDGDSKSRLQSTQHLHKVFGSDHCPVALTIKS